MKIVLILLALAALWMLFRPRKPAPMPPDAEARAVLGVSPDADADTIRAAHRRLAASVHPDRGGSAELARRVNAARDTLLRR